MEQIRFRGAAEGIEMDRVMREREYSMAARHFHNTYELYYLLEGERYYFIDQETYLVKEGDAVFIRPEQIHKTSDTGKGRHERILLQIQEEPLRPFLKVCRTGGLEELFEPGAAVIGIPKDQKDEVKGLFFSLERELGSRQEHGAVMGRLLLLQILLTLSRCQQKKTWYQEPPIAQTWKHQKVREVARYLTRHPETSESLGELAARFYVSRSYLSRIFKEVTSFTVNEYKNISRIKKSQNLLAHSACSITEIAEILGYETVTYYERVFKKYTATTPLKYRNKAKTELGTGSRVSAGLISEPLHRPFPL